jgi:hypothetical protein
MSWKRSDVGDASHHVIYSLALSCRYSMLHTVIFGGLSRRFDFAKEIVVASSNIRAVEGKVLYV